MEMPRYFSDLDNGKTKYLDTIGTELANVEMAEREAVRFLASVFRDALPEESDSVFVVTVRDNSRVIFTTTLTHQSDRPDTDYGMRAIAAKRPVAPAVEDDPFL
jgi:hypothetical protein